MKNLFGQVLYAELMRLDSLYEVRLCLHCRVVAVCRLGKIELNTPVTSDLLDKLIYSATDGSVYALSDRMKNGYIEYKGGIRIGLAGEYVFSDNKIISIKTITSCVVRIPHEIKGCSKALSDSCIKKNILVVAPPMGGKTTFLRDIARRLAQNRKNVVVLDERGELSGGISAPLDILGCDILLGLPKALSFEGAIRALSPEYLITDELFGMRDYAAVRKMMACGVHVAAGVHAESVLQLPEELKCFDVYVTLSRYPCAGTVKEVRYA